MAISLQLPWEFLQKACVRLCMYVCMYVWEIHYITLTHRVSELELFIHPLLGLKENYLSPLWPNFLIYKVE